ncbi:MAG: hypothetical protein U9N56_04290 [Actinomycetota bacterium]|nr:hypothetical protein [Actinomycetota bacterium]
MSHPDDYSNEVSNTEFVDQDVERLVTGRSPDDPGLGELTSWIEALRSESLFVPSNDSSERMAAQAAAIVRSDQTTMPRVASRGNIARPDRRPSLRPARAAFALSGFALLLAAVAIGFVAHTSVPGDPLYAIDLAMEQIGIGDGTVNERIDEADTLVAAGDQIEALILLGKTYERAAANGNLAGAEQAERRLATVSTVPSGTSLVLASRVERLREFIAENAGPGVGLDGDDFYRALEDIAREEP